MKKLVLLLVVVFAMTSCSKPRIPVGSSNMAMLIRYMESKGTINNTYPLFRYDYEWQDHLSSLLEDPTDGDLWSNDYPVILIVTKGIAYNIREGGIETDYPQQYPFIEKDYNALLTEARKEQ